MARSNDHSPAANDSVSLETSTVHRLNSSAIRRDAISVLANAEGTLSLADLSDAVVAETDVDHDSRRDLVVCLHHVHLPMLDDAGVVDYDADGNLVHPRYDAIDALDR